MVMLESTMHNRVEAGCSVMASSVPKHFLCSAADDILRLTNNFSDFVLPSSLAEEVTVVDTVSGPMVWCTFKNFLSVTFIFEEEKKSPGISLLRLLIHFIYFSNSRGANISLAQCKGHQRRGPVNSLE